MKVKNLFGMAALLFAAALTSCSSDDFMETGDDTPQQTIHFTATIGQKGEGTRGLKEEDTYIDAFWQVGEKIAVVDRGGSVLCEAEVTIVDMKDRSATIEGDIEGASTGDVTLIYPASAVDKSTGDVKEDLLYNQRGTLDDIAKNCDVAKAGATLVVDNSKNSATLDPQSGNDEISFNNEYAICKFEFPSLSEGGIRRVDINDANDLISRATLANNNQANTVYMAMAPSAKQSLTFTVIATNGKRYGATATATVNSGKFYNLSVGLKEEEEVVGIGYFVNSDGSITESAQSNSVAVVFSLDPTETDAAAGYRGYAMGLLFTGGSTSVTQWDNDAENGFLYATKDAENGAWRYDRDGLTNTLEALEAVGGTKNRNGRARAFVMGHIYTNRPVANCSYWFLPAIGQLYDICVNLGKLEDKDGMHGDSSPTNGWSGGTVSANVVDNINQYLAPAKALGLYVNDFETTKNIWSSSEYSRSQAFILQFSPYGFGLSNYNKTNSAAVRPILAF